MSPTQSQACCTLNKHTLKATYCLSHQIIVTTAEECHSWRLMQQAQTGSGEAGGDSAQT